MRPFQICVSGLLVSAFLVSAPSANAKIKTDPLAEAVAKAVHDKDAVNTARKSGGKVHVRGMTFTHKYDKASPVLKQAPPARPLKGGLLDNSPDMLSTQGPTPTGTPSAPVGARGTR